MHQIDRQSWCFGTFATQQTWSDCMKFITVGSFADADITAALREKDRQRSTRFLSNLERHCDLKILVSLTRQHTLVNRMRREKRIYIEFTCNKKLGEFLSSHPSVIDGPQSFNFSLNHMFRVIKACWYGFLDANVPLLLLHEDVARLRSKRSRDIAPEYKT